MTRQKIKNLVKKAIKQAQKKKKLSFFKVPEISVERPLEKIHGNYSVSIALEIAKLAKKNPIEIAEIIVAQLINFSIPEFEKIEVVKPGFINFFFSKEYLQKQVSKVLKEKFNNINIGKGKKIQIEFISANPTGPLTVGNSRGGPFGDVLGNVFKMAGFKVEKAYYVNDCGMQILTLGNSVLKNKEAQYKGQYIDSLNKRIKLKDPYKVGELAAKIIIDEIIKKTVKKMGIKFDEWFLESSLHKKNEVEKTLNFLKRKKLTYKKEGALWFKSLKYGDNRDRVLVKRNGWKTYLAGDIAYHKYKFKNKKFDKVINVWGADHYGDVAGLQAGVRALGYRGKLDIILTQFITLFQNNKKLKISKRRGVYVSMDELLEEISTDVMRFFFLQRSSDSHLNFDLSLAKEQSKKNPVYYIQYAYARINSIIAKSKIKISKKLNFRLLNHSSELNLIKQIIRFPEIIEDTVKDYQVQRIPQYTIDLAGAFHQFYRDCKVITKDKELMQARLALIKAVKIALKSTLDLMGVSAPEKM
ncbi:MAG TPA: arginine--tRNA ligase [bacterium]|nr:arginine--tRNA ligase [bacterium]